MTRSFLFSLLRLYVAIEQSAFVRWCCGKNPDLVLEPLPRADDAEVPEVHDTPSLFIDADCRAAYVHHGATLRRAALNEHDELVYIRKPSKKERRAMKRSRTKGQDARAVSA